MLTLAARVCMCVSYHRVQPQLAHTYTYTLAHTQTHTHSWLLGWSFAVSPLPAACSLLHWLHCFLGPQQLLWPFASPTPCPQQTHTHYHTHTPSRVSSVLDLRYAKLTFSIIFAALLCFFLRFLFMVYFCFHFLVSYSTACTCSPPFSLPSLSSRAPPTSGPFSVCKQKLTAKFWQHFSVMQPM